MAAGGEGVISVVSNATPRLMARLVDWCARGDFAEARALALRLTPWFQAAFVDANPIPVKAALSMMGKIENVLRLPLVPLEDTHIPIVRRALAGVEAVPA
jgi:4-hydroxy-tetrahydrodipicolinate synthase